MNDDETIKRMYLSGLSLRQIAKEVGLAHPTIARRLNEMGVKLRSLAEARQIALSEGRLPGRQARTFNEKFFDDWSSKSAYVIGLLAADGCISKRFGKEGQVIDTRVTISLTDRQLIDDVEKVLDGNLTIMERQVNKKKQYVLQMYSAHVVNRLIEVGITPRKSLDLRWPDMPIQCVPHFVRGVFDGDGSVFQESRSGKCRVSFVGGSLTFFEELKSSLLQLSIETTKIYTELRSKNPSYKLRVNKEESIGRFYNFIYSCMGKGDVCLLRKRQKFESLQIGQG